MEFRPRSLVLALTSRCNLTCRYCYQAAGRQGEDMPEPVLEQALALADHGHSCHIQLTGGEPCLVPETIEQVLRRAREFAIRPHLAIQTNATLLEPDLVRLFADNGVQVGVSLDGEPEIQEELRGRADASLRGLVLLEKMRVPFRVTTVVTDRNCLALDRLALLLAGFAFCRGLGLDLLVRRGRAAAGAGITPPAPDELERGIRALARTLARINRRRYPPLALRELDLLTAGRPGRPFCHAATGHSLAVRPDGHLFPCSQTMGEAGFALGTVWRPQPENRTVLTRLRLTGRNCTGCPLESRCPGDCPSRLFHNRHPATPLACILYRSLAATPFAPDRSRHDVQKVLLAQAR